MNDLISRQAAIEKDINVPINDTISRQAAIDALSHMMDTDGFRDGWAVSRANVDCMLRSLPSAQSGRYKWNPIKDGLPDEEGVYFVTDDAGGMATVYLDVFSHYEDGSPYWLYSQNVTAWMHTPEPYQRGDEE